MRVLIWKVDLHSGLGPRGGVDSAGVVTSSSLLEAVGSQTPDMTFCAKLLQTEGMPLYLRLFISNAI